MTRVPFDHPMCRDCEAVTCQGECIDLRAYDNRWKDVKPWMREWNEAEDISSASRKLGMDAEVIKKDGKFVVEYRGMR